MTEQDRSLGLEDGGTGPDRGGPARSWLPFVLVALVSIAAGVGGTALFLRAPQPTPRAHAAHLLSDALIVAGFALLASSWRVLHSAQQRSVLAVKGPYSYVHHPQYVAFLVIMLGFLLQWPTLATLLMLPVLTWSYLRLARKEERQMAEEFGCAWKAYAYGRPAFLPRLPRVCAAFASLRGKRQARIDRQRFTTGAGAPATRGRTS